MLAIVEAVILRPLPYRDPDRIAAIWEARPAEGQEKFRMAAGNFNEVRSLNHVFEKGALFGAAGFRLLGEGAPEQILGARVEPEYFQVLGVHPSLGRVFTPEDAREGAARVVIIGHGLFQRRFGGRADLLALTAAPAVLMATVLLAAAWPTRRALGVDPAVILRG